MYIADVLSINNQEFENCLGQMYPAELEIKDTTDHFCFLHGFTTVDWRDTLAFTTNVPPRVCRFRFLCVRNNSGLVISVLTFDVRFALMLFSPWMATLYFSGRNLSAVLGTIE